VKQQQLLADLVITCCFKTRAAVSACGNCSMRDRCKSMTAQQLCTYGLPLQRLLPWLLTCRACFALPLATCQVHQVKLAHTDVARAVRLCRIQCSAVANKPAAAAA
jgi:hypothetical protein